MKKNWWHWLRIALLVLVPVILLWLPADFFDEGVIVCPSKQFFNFECLGCGMTRAVMHLIHLDVESALYYNPGSFIVVPILVFFWLRWLLRAVKNVAL